MPCSVPHLLTFSACAHAVPSGWASGVPKTFPLFRCQPGHLLPKPCLMPKIGQVPLWAPAVPCTLPKSALVTAGVGVLPGCDVTFTDGCAQLTAVCPAPVWYPAPGVVSSVSQQSWALTQACPVLQCPPGSREPGAACEGPHSPAGTLAPSPSARLHTHPLPTIHLPPTQVSILQKQYSIHHLQQAFPDYTAPRGSGAGHMLPRLSRSPAGMRSALGA